MRIVKYILLALLVIIVGFLIYAAIQPAAFEVSRTRTIDAPVSVVYNLVDDYKDWETWGPWAEEDPEMVYTYAEQTSGVGASYSWEGKDGKGSATTIEEDPGKSLVNQLDFGGMGTAHGFWKFEDLQDSTRVTWGIRTEDSPYIMKIFSALYGSYDNMMGPMFERGLEKLDSVALVRAEEWSEKMSQWTIGEITITEVEAQEFIGYRKRSKRDHESMSAVFMEYMPKAGEYARANGLAYEDFTPGALYFTIDDVTEETELLIGLFLHKNLAAGEGMEAYRIPKGQRVKVTKFGNYGKGDAEAVVAIGRFMMDNGLAVNGPMYEMYMNDPTLVEPQDIQTDMFFPVTKEIYYGTGKNN